MANHNDLALERTKQVFRFLKAFAERNIPVRRTLAEQEWFMRLRDLPAHPSIALGTVAVPTDPAGNDEGATPASAEPLLRVSRPRLTDPPSPPHELNDWVLTGWQRFDGELRVIENRPQLGHDGQTEMERFSDDPLRVQGLGRWRAAWAAWHDAELPARKAMKVFEQLYGLLGRIELESEKVELMLGDGRLIWLNPQGGVNHPILLQRVELEFDSDRSEFRLLDSDRSPELYAMVLVDDGGITGQQLHLLRDELKAGGYHPLAEDGTAGYLRRVTALLGPRAVYQDEPPSAQASENPVVGRDPVLFLRARLSGFPAAFDRVLLDLQHNPELPYSLQRIVGVEPPPPDGLEHQISSPWAEPVDVLLSMPANPEQVQIVRALDRHRAVLVQGPPGTGKSYTIANLIGHLVAQGKRVLVTSHTTKALRVLRDLIVDSLQPLAVAVLDNDIEGRALMEKAVRGIVSRLATANEVQLSADITRLAEKRQRYIEEIERITDELRLAREAEYLDIFVGGGDTIDPTQAAREANSGHECNCWLPGPLHTGAPLPLSALEIRELYASNATITEEEEREVSDDLPSPAMLKDPEAFRAAIAALGAVEPEELAALWEHPPAPIDLDPLRELVQGVESFSRELATLEYWQRSVVAAGHAGHGEREIWVSLRAQIVGAAERWDKARAQFLSLGPETSNCLPRAVLQSTVIEIRDHLVAGGKIGGLTLFFNGRWKKAVDGCRVNGEPPSTSSHFASIAARLKIDDGREQLARQWNRQALPAGFPAYEQIPAPPELVLRGYADQVDGLLDWWHQRWVTLEKLLNVAGFRWKLFRDREMAKLPPSTAFELDAQLLTGPLTKVIGARLRILECRAAETMLTTLNQALTAYHGPICLALRQAVQGNNPAAYSAAYTDYERLSKRVSVWSRRKELLNKLESAASGWAVAIRARAGVHGGAIPPGEVTAAWRWRQIEQEVKRRASLDDMSLKRRLEIRRVDLHETTIDLIDRKAWLAQRRRTGLGAQQALIGWSDIQNRIGRGTGKRVPALQAEARRLLAKAQEAVPVWIMPLSRVAESFDPTLKKFDVVIVDEASQADVTGLLACYLGDQIAIVGDHEQVSPSAVGQKLDEITTLIEQHLVGIPNSILYDGKTSIYHLARQSFGGTIGLREHFRCVPDIIEFSNYLSYGGEIRPLRDPRTAPTPHVIEYAVPQGLGSVRGDNKTNEAEARIIAALSAAAIEDDSYRGKTMGAITLLGEEQAWMILEKLRQLVRSEELERRHFVAGNSAQFQGDERHVIWLSMVDTPKDGPLPIRQTVEFKQRFNVAASRAKDQLWLVHSLDPGRDLQHGDLRRQLIEHVRDPGFKRRTIHQAHTRAESEFEKDVIQRLIGAGFKVQPQVWAGYHRIDIVVSDEAGQVAIECDGDRYHPFDKIPEDMARQAILERAGWRFIRIRGTRFYRDPGGAIEWVACELQRLGVRPVAVEDAGAFFVDQAGQECKDAVIRRAWEIMREQGWVAKH